MSHTPQPSITPYVLEGKRIWVAGHPGMVGSALLRRLENEPCDVLTVGRDEVDLTQQEDVRYWLYDNLPDTVILAAAKVGGILANDTYPADFLYENLMIEANIIHAAHEAGVQKLVFLGSSCIYPKLAEQPIEESSLLTGALEPTNEWYALAKISGVKLCQAYRKQYGSDFISVMPTNLYGPGDNFDLNTSHVIPALMRKAHEARMFNKASLDVWGTGVPRREFLHVDDAADGIMHIMTHYSELSPINLGCGQDVSIAELAQKIAQIVDFKGSLSFDISKPEGAPRKLLNVEKLTKLGWRPNIPLEDGLRDTYTWFRERY